MDLGPKPGVSLRVAVLAEGVLTFLLNLVILYATGDLLCFPACITHRLQKEYASSQAHRCAELFQHAAFF